MTRTADYGRAADLLLALETRMRSSDLWSDDRPSELALASTAPFAADSLGLAEWLQFLFIPRMAALIEHGAAFPDACAIRPMAELMLARETGAAAGLGTLLEVLGELDALLTSDAST